MISDVRIRRLNLKVVQHGAPWLGHDELNRTGELARRAVLADLESILERALAGCTGDERLGAIELDVTLDGGLADRVVPFARPQLRAQLATALERATTAALAERCRVGAPAEAAVPAPEPFEPTPAHKTSSAARRLALLLAWRTEGCLAERVRLLPAATIGRWLPMMLDALDLLPLAPASHVSASGITIAAPLENQMVGEAEAAGARSGPAAALMALVAIAAQWAPFRPPESLIAVLRIEALRSNGRREVADQVTADSAARGSASATGAAATPRDSIDTSIIAPGDAEPAQSPLDAPVAAARTLPLRCPIHTALPFLMLGPLDRIGWLTTADALLAQHTEPMHAHALGYVLALKALPVPERGWRHAPEHAATAAFAAGLASPPSGEDLARMACALGEDLPALDAVVADALARGHDRHAPLVLVATPPGVALVEPEGLFALALGTAWSDIATVATAAGAPLLLDPRLPASICAEVDAAGLTFVAPGAPTRRETWHSLTGRGAWRGMTNATAERHSPLIEAAVRHGGVAEEARVMLNSLGPDRPLAPGLASDALDRSAIVAAALALGETCWRLAAIAPAAWASPDPLLALERFGDLPATMNVAEQEIEIRLPLGPRSRDLAAAGLLADVGPVPWLGRRLRFGIG